MNMTQDTETRDEARALATTLLDGGGRGDLSLRERRVIERIARRVRVTDINDHIEERETLGDRLADRVAAIGGSWAFIIAFGVFMVAWAILNVVLLAADAFDPYPFVFLNLLLSMLAALQAPVIMMSQNRQAVRDRAQADADYDTNLQSATYLLTLHEKVDRLQSRLDGVAAPGEPHPAATDAPAECRLAAD
jgi:uncharacterized membrane protein